MALLHLLRARAGALDLRVVAAHLDHGMRRGSAADRRFVESESRRLGVPVVSERRPVSELRRRDESPEEAARRVRHGFLREIAARHECERIALGHTLDDQAETVLFRLLRGSGPTGLAGMGAAGPGPYVRPLLDLARADVRAYLDRRGLRFREDPTNRDLRYDRNRLRLRVLPLLAEMCNPQAAAHLVRAADLLREDARFLDVSTLCAGGGEGFGSVIRDRAGGADLRRS